MYNIRILVKIQIYVSLITISLKNGPRIEDDDGTSDSEHQLSQVPYTVVFLSWRRTSSLVMALVRKIKIFLSFSMTTLLNPLKSNFEDVGLSGIKSFSLSLEGMVLVDEVKAPFSLMTCRLLNLGRGVKSSSSSVARDPSQNIP